MLKPFAQCFKLRPQVAHLLMQLDQFFVFTLVFESRLEVFGRSVLRSIFQFYVVGRGEHLDNSDGCVMHFSTDRSRPPPFSAPVVN